MRLKRLKRADADAGRNTSVGGKPPSLFRHSPLGIPRARLQDMIGLLLVLVILGVCLYLAETYIPMDPVIKTVIRVVVVLFAIVYLLRAFGVADFDLPRLR